jgi:hypothetical protein
MHVSATANGADLVRPAGQVEACNVYQPAVAQFLFDQPRRKNKKNGRDGAPWERPTLALNSSPYPGSTRSRVRSPTDKRDQLRGRR